eukprot:COSAG05_NODE_165_length_15343_cov_194.625492_3_plen_471_part_00
MGTRRKERSRTNSIPPNEGGVVWLVPALLGAVAAVLAATAYVELNGATGELPGSMDPSGGYSPSATVEGNPTWRAEACDIERRADLSPSEFRSEFRNKKPFILHNSTRLWRAGAFSQAHLSSKYGGAKVKTGISKHIPKNSGDAYNPMTMSKFLSKMSGDQEVLNDPLYTFDLNEFLTEQAPELLEEVLIPEELGGVFKKQGLNFYFALGGALSGTQFHRHTEGWYIQIFGAKKWMLYPKSRSPPIHYPPTELSVMEWMEEILPQVGTRTPFECTLTDGDLIYIPESWYHATLNLGESVGVAGQLIEPSTEYQKMILKGDKAQRNPAQAAGWYEKAVAIEPTNVEANYLLGMTLTQAGRLKEGLAISTKALELDAEPGQEGDHTAALTNIGMSHILGKDYESAEKIFRDVIAIFSRAPGVAKNWALALKQLGKKSDEKKALKLVSKNEKLARRAALGGAVKMTNMNAGYK